MLNNVYLQAIIDAGDESVSRAMANNPDMLETIGNDEKLIEHFLPLMEKDSLSKSYSNSKKVRKFVIADLKKHHDSSKFMEPLREIASGSLGDK